METTTPTAREQFVRDYLMVVENDQSAYNTLTEWAEEFDSTYALAVHIQNEWEEAVIENTGDIQDETMRNLMRQMLIGYGIDPFYDIACQFRDAGN